MYSGKFATRPWGPAAELRYNPGHNVYVDPSPSGQMFKTVVQEIAEFVRQVLEEKIHKKARVLTERTIVGISVFSANCSTTLTSFYTFARAQN